MKLILGDALDILPTLPDASADIIVADPPYHRVKDAPWDRQWRTDADYLAWMGTLLDAFRRVLKPNGSLYVFASPRMAARVEVAIGERFEVLNRITWRKDDGWAKRQCKEEQRAFFPASEAIVFAEQCGAGGAVNDESGYTAKCDSLHRQVYAPVVGKAVQAKRVGAGLQRHQVDSACAPSQKPTGLCYRWEAGDCLPTEGQFLKLCRLCGDERGEDDLRREYEDLRREYEDLRRPFTVSPAVPCADVWDFAPVQDYPGKHPCEKPWRLLAHVVNASSRPGAVVLDPFAGSGALGPVCADLGREYVGIELDPTWHGKASRRLQEGNCPLFAGTQGPLFAGAI